MKFTVSQFWSEKRPTKKSEDRIPIMLGPAKSGLAQVITLIVWNDHRSQCFGLDAIMINWYLTGE